MKILVAKDGHKFVFKGEDLHTQFGFVTKKEIDKAKSGKVLETNKGKKMTVLDASFKDIYERIKRSAQIIPLKDIGFIISEVGLDEKWRIVDAGSGSGAISCFLGHLIPKGKVFTYDIREDHINIVKKNISLLELKNVKVKKHDIYEGIPEKKINMIMLDVPEPWKVLEHVDGSLLSGGFLVSYSPTIPQVSDFVEGVCKCKGLVYLKTVEIGEREWEFVGRKIRPKTSQRIGHSGFISFVRKL
jgi:tRNA (adenine57-N1/adenine58-N1)-methyltransferase